MLLLRTSLGQESRLQVRMISAAQCLEPGLENSKAGAGIIRGSLAHSHAGQWMLDVPRGVPLGLPAEAPTRSLSGWPGFLRHVVGFQVQLPRLTENDSAACLKFCPTSGTGEMSTARCMCGGTLCHSHLPSFPGVPLERSCPGGLQEVGCHADIY